MIGALREECAKKGFDLCDPIHTQWYNDLIEEEGHVAKGTLQKIPEPSVIVERKGVQDGDGGHGDYGDYGNGDHHGDGGGGIQYNAVLIGKCKG